ncbi:MAG: adenylate/guanylate cyclase domain-containing protein [Actinobacteria bacterium]|nr:adenylate/guanylate cyclase domain-containing protein [Actinomycetota bacterium]
MRDLPRGTVTFLFTDVEGSTRLLHELGAEDYAAALAEHRRLIRAACAARDGVEVDTQGDAFFFAFPTAPGALSAASAMTEALASGRVQVRIGLHTGTPLLTEEGYVGDDVHFGARVAASGHGGQILLSAATGALLEPSDDSSRGVSLIDLGEHRLKNIEGAVSSLQLGEGSFPPLKTISNTNLPRPASSFVGRERELAEVLAKIEHGARLLTLTGPGGTGKTRLALEAGATLVPEYKAGVFWVGLASLRDPALVSETIAQVLGAKDSLAERIAERELLLLLDNLEQVVDSAPELSQLLSACPNLTLLVTSRELLRVQGEVEYPVPPLAEPEAVSLFCERAPVEPSEEISELCARLDSLPLAVELAAARTKALSPAQILARLSQRLDLLKGGRDSDPRQQTLRATIEWSYDLLPPEEQVLFRRLAVFAGGCTLEAAEEVADADLDTLQSLVEKSLLRFSDERYWMLETIRDYAAERLEESEDRAWTRERHTEWVLALSEAAMLGLQSADNRDWLNRVEVEYANIRAALASLAQKRDVAAQAELISRLWVFWDRRGHWREGLRHADRVITATVGQRSEERSTVLGVAGNFASKLGEVGAAYDFSAEALAIARELGEPKAITRRLILLGYVAGTRASYAEAEGLLQEARELARATDEPLQFVSATINLVDVVIRQHKHARGVRLGQEAVSAGRELGSPDLVAYALCSLAFSQIGMDDDAAALATSKEGFSIAQSLGTPDVLSLTVNLLSALAARRGDSVAGARLLGVVDVLRERLETPLAGPDAELYQVTLAQLRSDLGEERFRSARAEGKKISRDETVEQVFTP